METSWVFPCEAQSPGDKTLFWLPGVVLLTVDGNHLRRLEPKSGTEIDRRWTTWMISQRTAPDLFLIHVVEENPEAQRAQKRKPPNLPGPTLLDKT